MLEIRNQKEELERELRILKNKIASEISERKRLGN